MIKQTILLLLGLLGGSLQGAAQNIVAAEYFFDIDPGVNNATGMIISNPADSINLLDSINITGLARGKHQFCIRYQNALGHWSHSACYPIEVSQSQTTPLIVGGEWFVNIEPGVGNGVPFTVTNPADPLSGLDSLNLDTLSKGTHQFCVRYYNNMGQWSHTNCHTIQVSQPQTTPLIVGGEWFVNVEPGIGNGVPFTVTNPADPLSGLDSLDLDTLSKGTHRFCVRYHNNMGQWSHTECYTIQVSEPQAPTTLVAGEYFFDTDPGLGNGLVLNNFAPADSINLLDSLPIGNLNTGLHVFGLRYRNNRGQWSHTARYLVQVVEEVKVVALEYVVDGTPGIQVGTVVGITPPASFVQYEDSVNTTPLAVGWHTLNVRVQNERNEWSDNRLDSFYVCNGVLATANVMVSDSTICNGEPVNFTASINNAGPNPSYSWLLNGTAVSSGQITYTTDSIQAGDIVSFYLESDAYCVLDSTIVSAPVAITVHPNPVVIATPSSTALCAGELLTLTATGANSYSWDNGIPNGQAFIPLFSQTYEVIGTDTTGCADTVSTVFVPVNPLPIINFTPLAVAYCDTLNAVPLSATPIGGTFSGTGVNNAIFVPSSVTAGNLYPITYTYTDNNGCTDSVLQIANVLDCSFIATSTRSELQSLQVYPNPTSHFLTLELESPNNRPIAVRLVTTLGQVIYESTLEQSGIYQIDVETLPVGTYFLQTINEEGQQTRQAIVKN
ncbi:MAG: T9SS type A sorting domain-containing protein [Aureispira sp.]